MEVLMIRQYKKHSVIVTGQGSFIPYETGYQPFWLFFSSYYPNEIKIK